MSDKPDAQDLLQVAREELMQRVLPALPASARYEVLMIANAMAIAAREIDIGRAHDMREQQSLRQLLSEDAATPDAALPRQLEDCRRQLCAAIRKGRFDPGHSSHREMLKHLRTTARDKIMISNPKLLSKVAK